MIDPWLALEGLAMPPGFAGTDLSVGRLEAGISGVLAWLSGFGVRPLYYRRLCLMENVSRLMSGQPGMREK